MANLTRRQLGNIPAELQQWLGRAPTLEEVTAETILQDRVAEYQAYLDRPFEIILALDGDSAGQAATYRTLQRLGHIHERTEPRTSAEIRQRIAEIEQHLNARPRFPDDMLELWRSERSELVKHLYKPRPAHRDELPDLPALVEQYTQLRQRGRELVGLCPKHSERSPSFTVNAQKQVWHDFHTGEGGNAATFLRWLGVSNA